MQDGWDSVQHYLPWLAASFLRSEKPPEKDSGRRVTRRSSTIVLARHRLSRSHLPLKKGRLRANSNATNNYLFGTEGSSIANAQFVQQKADEAIRPMAEVFITAEREKSLFSTVCGAADTAHSSRHIHKFFTLRIEQLAPRGQQNGRRGGTRTPDPRIRNSLRVDFNSLNH